MNLEETNLVGVLIIFFFNSVRCGNDFKTGARCNLESLCNIQKYAGFSEFETTTLIGIAAFEASGCWAG